MKPKLHFKPFEESESERLAQWIASEKWPFHGTEAPSVEQVRQSIAGGFYTGEDNKTFWVYLKERPEPIAMVCLHELTDLSPIFDIRIHSSVRYQGLGREIVNWLAQYVFTQTDKHRLEGHTRVDNIAMRRVFNACGWVKEAHYRKAWPDAAGNLFDALTYGVLKSDWEAGGKTMRPPRAPFVKICCIANPAEAAQAIAAGASALGLVSAMPSGPGVLDDQTIAEIAATIPPPIASFLLTARQTADAIIQQHQLCRTGVIQLVDRVEHAELRKLRQGLPGIRLVQVIHVNDEASIAEAKSVAGFVDALLLDSGNQGLAVKELGGTGRTHDWSLSRRIRDEAGLPVFLAGGLKAGNVAEAIRAVQPYGLDLCSGVRTRDKLDESKLLGFFDSVAESGKRMD